MENVKNSLPDEEEFFFLFFSLLILFLSMYVMLDYAYSCFFKKKKKVNTLTCVFQNMIPKIYSPMIHRKQVQKIPKELSDVLYSLVFYSNNEINPKFANF